MPFNLQNRMPALKLMLFSVLSGWILSVGALFTPIWQPMELKIFDVLSVFTAPKKSSLPITIIGIDEASFTQLGVRWPWPRTMHAQLVDRLAQSGAAVIAFDVLFPEPGSPEEDEAFARSIAAAGNVMLAADNVYHETDVSRQWLRMDPVATFTLAGATTGLATMSLDGDTIARRMAEADDAFWREAIRTLIRSRPGSVEEPYVPSGAMMRHLGPTHTFPYVSYYQVLNGDPSIPPDFFLDQIVIVGRDVRASPELGAAQADTFATPFLMTTGLLTPGVEIHATQIENALMGQTILPASQGLNILAISCVLFLAMPLLFFWSPLRSTLVVVVIGGATLGVSAWLFVSLNLLLATATPLLALAIAFFSTSAGSYFTERRRAMEIRSAFSKYVSTDVVEEMIAHPEHLKLGGHRREISVLFSDLAGFTTLSEKLSADAVATVINLYLNAMTRIIMAHEGTVDKFIGDAIMAFWGAPLDDPEHALHAVQSAIAMQEAMRDLQPQFRTLGVDVLKLRIGINSGPAIVGNMGSDLRFDYTAIGDTVNLASRLEGANKAYGTKIMLAHSTAAAVVERIPLRQIDRVRVKGKNVPVDVFTPCDDAPLAEATERAWAAYLAKDWGSARAGWQEIRNMTPDDSLIEVFEKKISACESSPPPPDWDGSVALEKL
ncbi:MAG: adenylate/guanylate cyclase domain-containing protein [Desulfobulbaceae bacterium]|nr:adenylate/guanylate cyclase domain-containing protein [Desulfobulbaceae bacterium]HIJ90376.1 adenylate/guanylate cyclase domain-containing protein [Deltaproteobacteria bacterium]